MCGTEVLTESHERAVRAELDRLLDSPVFRTSKRCREFLAYIVNHTIDGANATLKERSIGVDLFQLPHDFDTGQHTIVRVTATEVRKKLAQHYLAENGSYHPVRIQLPTGCYAAEFRWNAPAPEKPVPVQINRVRPTWPSKRVVAYAAAAIFLIAAVSVLWREYTRKTISASAKAAALPNPTLSVLPHGPSLRMSVGSNDSYIDRSGRTWEPERFFSGGSVLVHPAERIFRTLDPDIYRRARYGDFKYDIPLQPGSYELHLYFAETGLADFISAESSGEGQRVFRVSANGRPILDPFDVVADAAGSNISDERVFRNISPAPDGFLHLSFSSIRGTAMVSGIELLPVSPGEVRPVRIRAGWPAAWQDSDGRRWDADAYFLGGNALVRTTNPARDNNSIRPAAALYASERWGNFSYAVPVAEGRYRMTLKFCEGHYGRRNIGIGGAGSRIFDVYCNGVALLRNFDIIKEAGGEGRPLDRTFSGLHPTAQGKIVVSFVPVKGMACVNAIEIEPQKPESE